MREIYIKSKAGLLPIGRRGEGEDDGSGVPFNFINVGLGVWYGGADLEAGGHQVKIERQVSA